MWSSLDRRFEPIVEAPAQARAFLSDVLAPRRGDAVDAAVLLTSELATNVVRHAHTPFVVRLEWHEPTLHVEVSDSDPTPPIPRVSPNGSGGHGLRFLAALADAWGARRWPTGKTVWFDVDVVTESPQGVG